MVTQPFRWMWTMSGLETGPCTRLLPHNPLHLFFSILISNSNYQSCFFFIPKPKQLLLLQHFLFLPILFTAGPKKSLVSITWFLLIVSQALLRPCLVKAGTLMLRNNDIDKLLTESRLNHNRRWESLVTSRKLPNGSWARIQFSYHQLTFMTTSLSLHTCESRWNKSITMGRNKNISSHGQRFCFTVKSSWYPQKAIFLFFSFLLKA